MRRRTARGGETTRARFGRALVPSAVLGIRADAGTLRMRIQNRLYARVQTGMLKEVQSLRDSGISWNRLEKFGLEYKYGALYLQGKLSKKEALKELERAIYQYAKRQITWWKRNKEIKWMKI